MRTYGNTWRKGDNKMAVILPYNQTSELVKQAYSIATGNTEITVEDLTKAIDTGSAEIGNVREPFTKALIAILTKNWFTDSSYRSEYTDPFFVDSMEFGLIVQAISVTVPEVKDNPAWQTFTSGTSKVGEYTVYLPVVDSQYYTKTSGWSLPITISWSQWSVAFESMERMNEFVNYVLMMVDNAIIQHREDMNNANRNNYISERLLQVGGIGKIDLVAEYVAEKGITQALTVKQALNDNEFLRFSIRKINKIYNLFKKQTSLFNSAKKVRFTPSERCVIQLLEDFDSRIKTSLMADTFNADFLKLPNYGTVPFWEGVGDTSFTDVSSIKVTSKSGTTERSGIVGFISDKWAIMHTIKSERVASQFFDIENLTIYSYQFVDQYMNDLTQNGVVFVLNDYTPA